MKVVNKWISAVLDFMDVLGLGKSMSKAEDGLKTLSDCVACKDIMLSKYQAELRELKQQHQESDNMFMQVINHLPDMVWAKDVEGRYIMANNIFMKNFCYDMSWEQLQGKTDTEIAKLFKEKVGNENHTFGEKCANSDVIVRDTEKARRFLELGNINGKQMKLEVHKSPVYNLEGTLYAICGVGRDITEMHDELMDAIDASNACFGKEGREFLKKIANKYEFKD